MASTFSLIMVTAPLVSNWKPSLCLMGHASSVIINLRLKMCLSIFITLQVLNNMCWKYCCCTFSQLEVVSSYYFCLLIWMQCCCEIMIFTLNLTYLVSFYFHAFCYLVTAQNKSIPLENLCQFLPHCIHKSIHIIIVVNKRSE